MILVSGVCFGLMLLSGCNRNTGNDNKILEVKKIEYTGNAGLEEVSRLLEAKTELHAIDLINWDAFPYRPDVKFRDCPLSKPNLVEILCDRKKHLGETHRNEQ